MAELIKPLGNEQTFTTPNTFSNTNSSQPPDNLVRIVNVGNNAQVIAFSNSISSTQYANLTVLPYTEIIVRKWSNNTISTASANLLAVAVTYSQ